MGSFQAEGAAWAMTQHLRASSNGQGRPEHLRQVWGVAGGRRKKKRGGGGKEKGKEGVMEKREQDGEDEYGKHLSPALAPKPYLWPAMERPTPPASLTPRRLTPHRRPLFRSRPARSLGSMITNLDTPIPPSQRALYPLRRLPPSPPPSPPRIHNGPCLPLEDLVSPHHPRKEKCSLRFDSYSCHFTIASFIPTGSMTLFFLF